MQITFDFNKENIKVENGKLIIIMDSELEKKLSELNKIKFIPLKKPNDPNTKYYILDSGELVEMTK